MICQNCNKELDDAKVCTNCGSYSPLATAQEKLKSPKISLGAKPIMRIIFIFFIIIAGVYGFFEDRATEKNNSGISSYDSGNTDLAIEQLEDAYSGSLSDEAKLNTLKNLAYVYTTNGDTENAIAKFTEALAFTKGDPFEHDLVSAEIALLKGDSASASSFYYSAYTKKPNNFQINNALALFHLDLEEVAPDYVDYEKALTFAKKAYDLNKLEITKQNLAVANLFSENYDTTISLLSSTSFENHPYMAVWMGTAYLGKGDLENAKLYYDKAKELGAEVPPEFEELL